VTDINRLMMNPLGSFKDLSRQAQTAETLFYTIMIGYRQIMFFRISVVGTQDYESPKRSESWNYACQI
jgi:hypothetical protein